LFSRVMDAGRQSEVHPTKQITVFVHGEGEESSAHRHRLRLHETHAAQPQYQPLFPGFHLTITSRGDGRPITDGSFCSNRSVHVPAAVPKTMCIFFKKEFGGNASLRLMRACRCDAGAARYLRLIFAALLALTGLVVPASSQSASIQVGSALRTQASLSPNPVHTHSHTTTERRGARAAERMRAARTSTHAEMYAPACACARRRSHAHTDFATTFVFSGAEAKRGDRGGDLGSAGLQPEPDACASAVFDSFRSGGLERTQFDSAQGQRDLEANVLVHC